MDEATLEIVAAVVTTNAIADGAVLEALLDQVEAPIRQVIGDGAYDKRHCYAAIQARSARAVIPSWDGARLWQHGDCKAPPHPRDANLRWIRRVGREQWKRQSGYHRRSLVEVALFRLETIFGDRVRARSFAGQVAQLLVRCAFLNWMTHLGMPDSYAV